MKRLVHDNPVLTLALNPVDCVGKFVCGPEAPVRQFDRSFIGKRTLAISAASNPTGRAQTIIGPTVVCSKYGQSLCMSRSLGDR